MARKWAIGLIISGIVILVLMFGTGVGHVDLVPGADSSVVNATFVKVWWFTIDMRARPSTASNVVIGVAIAGLAALLTGTSMLVVSWVRRRRSP